MMVPWTATNVNTATTVTASSSMPMVTSSSSSSSSPPLPPPQSQLQHRDPEQEVCYRCSSTAIITDWAQGDKICTNCGVVLEEQLLDRRPEWKDYNTVEDIIKTATASAPKGTVRSGLVPVDETKYIGGLQPTILSKYAYGGEIITTTSTTTAKSAKSKSKTKSSTTTFSLYEFNKRLRRTNAKIDSLMEKRHRQQLKHELDQQDDNNKEEDQQYERFYHGDTSENIIVPLPPPVPIHTNSNDNHNDDESDDQQSRMKKQQQLERQRALIVSMNSEKWSLDRAMTISSASAAAVVNQDCNDDEYETQSQSQRQQRKRPRIRRRKRKYRDVDDDENDTFTNTTTDKIRSSLAWKDAARDLRLAYDILQQAATKLGLPSNVTEVCVTRLVKYAIVRDGLIVRGVSSRLTTVNKPVEVEKEQVQNKVQAEAEVAAQQKQHLQWYNRYKQFSSLAAALIYMTSRSMQCTRTIQEICECFEQPRTPTQVSSSLSAAEATTTTTTNDNNKQQQQQQPRSNVPFIRSKHCSRAMTELKSTLPEELKVVAVVGNGGGSQSQCPSTTKSTLTSSISPSPSTEVSNDNITSTATTTTTSTSTNNTNSGESIESIVNFVDHSLLRKLQLPPVAEACIRELIVYCRLHEINENNYHDGGMKEDDKDKANFDEERRILQQQPLQVLGAAITYFVCQFGSAMQRIAATHRHDQQQQQQQQKQDQSKKQPMTMVGSKRSHDTIGINEHGMTDEMKQNGIQHDPQNGTFLRTEEQDDVVERMSTNAGILLEETRQYEMKRMLDAWDNQIAWTRTVETIVRAVPGIKSKTQFHKLYKTYFYPKRDVYLNVLTMGVTTSQSALCTTPMAQLLLSKIQMASSLMSKK